MRRSATNPKSVQVQSPPKAASPDHLRTWQLAVPLALTTFALYWPAMRCGFISFDDPDFVTKNSYIHVG